MWLLKVGSIRYDFQIQLYPRNHITGRIAVLSHIGAESSYVLLADNFNAKIWMLSLMHKSSYHLNAKRKKVTQFVSITVYYNKVS